MPAGQEALHRLAAAFAKLADETYGLVVSVAERLVATVRQFEPEFAQFGQRVTALAKRLGGYAERYVQWARKEAADLWKLILDSVHELPGWEYARDKYTEVSAGWVVFCFGRGPHVTSSRVRTVDVQPESAQPLVAGGARGARHRARHPAHR